MSGQRVVIVGGGFGGVRCAKTLRRRLPPGTCEIVLFNRENHMVFHPLLPEVAGGSINQDSVAAPLRQILREVQCRTESVRSVDLTNRVVTYERYDGQTAHLPYDHVVIACGRTVELGMIPGMSDHAFALKTVGDAMAIRAHVIQQLENAEVCGDPLQRRWYLSFVIVGGGFSGVEVAGEINDLVRSSRRFYPNIGEEDTSVTLVHSGDQILPEISPNLREFAAKKMRKAGITVLFGARVAAATADGVWLQDESRLRGATVICTIGTSTPPLVAQMESPKQHGALLTDPDMRLRGADRAWAIGDCACIVNARDGRPCPPTGQFAERQGRQVAENIARVWRGEPTRPFTFRPLGQLCAIGGQNAVAEILGVRLSGFLAWFLWRSVYLFKLPSWSRRLKVGADWAWDLLFARDLVNLRTDPTARVSHAHFHRGDYVFRQGDPALNFYAVEKGEVEVIRSAEDGADELVAVLGPGDFFGEMALLENRPRSASVRARTDVDLTTLGVQVFSRISKSLAPLQQRLAETIRRRRTNLWTRLPEAHDLLSREPLTSFIEPQTGVLDIESTFAQAIRLFATGRIDVAYVMEAGHRLAGILTRTDLLHAVDVLATVPAEDRATLSVRRFMVADPVAVTLADSPATAALLMWNRGVKSLPVVNGADDRRVAGCVRAETMMHAVLQRLGSAHTEDRG